jgi:hypothetical protein
MAKRLNESRSRIVLRDQLSFTIAQRDVTFTYKKHAVNRRGNTKNKSILWMVIDSTIMKAQPHIITLANANTKHKLRGNIVQGRHSCYHRREKQ